MSWTVGRILFFTIAAALSALIHVYLYRRFVRDVTTRRRLRMAGGAVVAVLAVGSMVARPIARSAPDVVGGAVMFGALFWMGLAIYLFFTAVFFDLARGLRSLWRKLTRRRAVAPVDAERRAVLKAGVVFGAGALGGGVALVGAAQAIQAPRVVELPIRLPGLPKALEGFSVVQLTDVHVGAVIQGPFVRELVARTNALRPDLVAITGDLVDGTVAQLGRHVAPLRELRARYGSFFVTGNHDHYSGAADWVAALEGMDIGVLRNRRVTIGDAAASFDLLGVDDWGSERWGGGRYDLVAAAAGRDPARASVLLAHQPTNFDEVAKAGIGLQLSGHTHGGQMFPATFFGRLIWGERNAGLSAVGASQLFVSRGCGFVGPPMRVGAPSEIVKLVLLPA